MKLLCPYCEETWHHKTGTGYPASCPQCSRFFTGNNTPKVIK